MENKPDISNDRLDTQLAANCNQGVLHIENYILTLRGQQVMLDRDLASLYGVDTKRLNEQVKRNLARFPERYRFQLNDDEKDGLVAKCDRFNSLKHSSVNPYVFTEQGVAMLSAVLKSQTAVNTSIRIIDAFVAMRSFLMSHASIFQRIERLELKQTKFDEKIDALFDKLDQNAGTTQGVFFNGQIFDAYVLVSQFIKSAKKGIVLIDNYIDESVLVMLAKRTAGVYVNIYTAHISRQLMQDVEKHNLQYPGVTIHPCNKVHDRFLIIDEDVYHIGHSLKDLGKKVFAFSKMEVITGPELLRKLES